MSTEKKQLAPSGLTEEEINEAAEEAIKNGTMVEVDLLGNEEPYDAFDDELLDEMTKGAVRDLPVNRVIPVLKHLQGRILTIVDASYDDKERAKFVKDLVKDAFSSSSQWVYEMSIRDLEGL